MFSPTLLAMRAARPGKPIGKGEHRRHKAFKHIYSWNNNASTWGAKGEMFKRDQKHRELMMSISNAEGAVHGSDDTRPDPALYAARMGERKQRDWRNAPGKRSRLPVGFGG
eukprot:TRINITY_DN1650_c0_g1_i1.p1 TRINITY_DN1650_c0_g1~~TRINITY_DN1650_c0_g1_i1.p1  ORF type:complete len:111 (+),score=11.35 TRINITY_DN1650_c0_g1_i1:58-390(+)